MDAALKKRLEEYTFRVEYSPNCPKPYLIRLVGPGAGGIDGLPVGQTRDIFAYGMTFDEVVVEVLKKKESAHNKAFSSRRRLNKKKR